VIAVRAFNVTVSQVRDQVSQTLIGEMRMKFWSDSLVSIYQDNPPAQPVAIQLHKAIQKHKLSKRWLQRILSSREEILSDKSFQNLAALETYSENSVSSVLYLVLECMNFRDVNADHAASHIGRAQGLITLLRAIPYNASKQRVYVPLDLLVKHSVSQHNIIRGSSGKNVKDLVFDIASTANVHLEKVKKKNEFFTSFSVYIILELFRPNR
jgi:NADH dehydrogenase [ubiquinone] 1 alpha subcomplex assembly factor 6